MDPIIFSAYMPDSSGDITSFVKDLGETQDGVVSISEPIICRLAAFPRGSFSMEYVSRY